jgi:hypothetical protein
MPKICDKLVAKTAKEITAAAYEILASDNNFYKAWPRQQVFVNRQWRNFVGHARHALAAVLRDPTVHENLKTPIYEAFLNEGGFKASPDSFKPSALNLSQIHS